MLAPFFICACVCVLNENIPVKINNKTEKRSKCKNDKMRHFCVIISIQRKNKKIKWLPEFLLKIWNFVEKQWLHSVNW